jgi:hypothetical protein
MTSQSNLMVAAPVDRKSIGGLKALLATMNSAPGQANPAPGQANPANPLVPFGKLENLHFARFVILDDQTLDDIRLYGLPRQDYPVYLAFLADFDGDAAKFLTDLVKCAEPGLRRVFSFCDDFTGGADLLRWMRDHNRPAVTSYINSRGRTMQQVREEASLRQAIDTYLDSHAGALSGQSAEQIRLQLRKFVQAGVAAGSLTLTPPAPTPWGEKIGKAVHCVGVLLLLTLLSPAALVLLVIIRLRENTEPVFAPRPAPAQAKALADIEDHEFTNQFSAMGSWKPGLVRRWMVRYILLVIEWTARYWPYTKNLLARVRTIHAARWVYLDDRKRLLFATSYDGSLDSYNDDFINKVSFGLNVVFANGIGYPATRWLLSGGAKDEQKFKYFLRRHQLPTEVWYNAHPSMAAVELDRNSRIRKGLEAAALSEEAAREWVQLL